MLGRQATWVGHRRGPRRRRGDRPQYDLFAQALCDDSNRELDWLWYATRITSDAHRRVCLQRALRINPNSEPAKRALGTLARTERA